MKESFAAPLDDRSSSTLAGRTDLLVRSVTDYAIYMLDAQGVVISWNPGAERLKGYTADAIIGTHFSKFYVDEDREAGVPNRALATAAREGRFEDEAWRIRKDGTRFWAHVAIYPITTDDGDLLGYAKVTADLTERRKTEESLRRSEERFRLLVEGVTDYAIYLLDPNGIVTSWNAGAERFKGYKAEEIIGQHFSRFYREEEASKGAPARALETAFQQGHFEAEGWRVRKDGTHFWASVVIDPITDPTGKLVGFAKITRDLSERREAQLALERSQAAFFQSQKLEAIGKLTGGVAHDFNNLLSAILGSLDLAERRLASGEDVTRFIANARQATERGAALTQRMLAFARKQDLQIEAVDVASTVRGMTDLLSRTIGSEIQIETKFPLLLPTVLADRSQLELALVNLVVNAKDAMAEGGWIRLAAHPASWPGSDEKFVCLTVTDEGFGMDDETLEQALEPFFTTKGVGKGTGLGLPMVQGMIEQCGGRFKLASTEGQGTTAELWLPISEHAPPLTSKAPGPDALPITDRCRILVVDDDALIRMNTVMTLTDFGHDVREASSGSEALAILKECDVELLITDYAMPGMTGAELVDAALLGNPDLQVLIVSGYADLPSGETITAPRLGKPFTELELANAIAALPGRSPCLEGSLPRPPRRLG